MKICLIEQTCGLGDILMSIKIGCHFASQGYRVIWPVEPIYKNLSNRITTINKIEFPWVHDIYDYKQTYEKLSRTQISETTEIDGVLYVPIRRGFYSNFGTNLRKTCGHDEANMLSKFGMCGLNHVNWQTYFDLNRNIKKEKELREYLNINLEDKIHLVNNTFGTPPRWHETLNTTIVTPPNLKRIEMKVINGFSLFDWLGIFELASKIDTVATSLVFLFEKINLSCTPTVYSRNKKGSSALQDFSLMKKIYDKEYEYKE